MNRKTASSSDCVDKAGAVGGAGEIPARVQLVLMDLARLCWSCTITMGFSLKILRIWSWLEKGTWGAGAYRGREASRL